MKNITRVFLCYLILSTSATVCRAADSPLYLDPKQPVEARVKDLLSRMKVEEKLEQLTENNGIPGNERLGIPRLYKVEAVHGVQFESGAAMFPHSIALSSTWDVKLVNKVGSAIGEEAAAAGFHQGWSPLMDVARDPRWGRMEETYGEDAYLVSRMGVAWIKGFQSHGLAATPKHYAAHGAPWGGRDSHDVGFSERVMREIHLPPFRAAFEEAGARSVMNSYSTWFDVPAVASEYLLKGILREEWGFEGFVVSDCGSIENQYDKHHTAADYIDAARQALKAGVSCNCGYNYGRPDVILAAKAKKIPIEDIDFAAGRILREKFLLGLFEKPPVPPRAAGAEYWDSPEHRALALLAARESVILLKNEGGLLPLSKNIKSIAVIGENAGSPQLGDYSSTPKPGQVVSILDAVKKAVGPGVKVRFSQGYDSMFPETTMGIGNAVAAAKASDVAIVVVGDKSDRTSGEGHDRANLDLPRGQDELVKAVYKTGTPTVLIIVSGRPYTIEWAADNVKAIIETFYPGEEGGTAAAEVLFGDYNPAGRLPVTWPKFVGQEPLNYNLKPSGRGYGYIDGTDVTPRYRFGYGLSYTKFRYGDLKIDPEKTADGNVKVSVSVENIGGRDGDEVVQLYTCDMVSSVDTPVSELKAFDRVHIMAGEKKTVSFELTPYQLSLLDGNMDRVLEPGRFKVMVGGVSPWGKPGDRFKDRIGYTGPEEGVSGEFSAVKRLAADFVYEIEAPDSAKHGDTVTVTVTVSNKGAMTDIGEVKLFVDGKAHGAKRFELDPSKSKKLEFTVKFDSEGKKTLAAAGKSGLALRTISVVK